MKKLGFGLMRLPIIGGDHSNIDIEAVKRMVDEFISRGFTYFDTAYVYHGGKSEVAFREAVVKRYPRDAYTITTKLPLFSKPDRAGMEKMEKGAVSSRRAADSGGSGLSGRQAGLQRQPVGADPDGRGRPLCNL